MLVCAVSFSSILLIQSGRSIFDSVVTELAHNTGHDVELEIDRFVNTPDVINLSTSNALRANRNKASDINSVSRFLWDAPYRSIDYYISAIYFATTDGTFTSVEIIDLPSGRDDWEISISGPTTNGIYTDYSVRENGTPGKMVRQHGPYDPRKRPWYQSALANPERAVWSEIYTDFDTQSATLTRAMAVHDEHGELLGVAGVDLFLDHIQKFLTTLPISENSEVFIVDDDGLILGAHAPSIVTEAPAHNIQAKESPYPFTRAAVDFLQDNFTEQGHLNEQHESTLNLADVTGHLYFAPLGRDHGVNWTLGIFIPKNDFIGTVFEQFRLVIPLVVLVPLLAAAAVVAFVSLIVKPINNLAIAAKQIATGDFSVPINTTQKNEVGELANSIDHMQTQLRQTFDQLLLRDRAVGAVDVGIVICDANDPDLPIVYSNEALESLTGYKFEEMVGQNPRMFRGGNDSQASLETIRDALQNENAVQTILQNKRKDGTQYPCELTISPVRDDNGDLTHYIGVHEDISSRLESEAKIRQYQKSEAMGQLSRGIAHDFNNLLMIFSGKIQLLADAVEDAELKEHIHDAEAAVEMGTRLTQRILAFSREGSLEPVTLNLNSVVKSIFPMLQASLSGNITLQQNLEKSLWLTHVDPSEIENALVNLVVNARDAIAGTGHISISTSNLNSIDAGVDLPPGEYIELTVSDTGTGIDPDTLPKIFDPFFTTKDIGKGTGLGLASISGFARQSGGAVFAESQVGTGTTIRLLLPRETESANTVTPGLTSFNNLDTVVTATALASPLEGKVILVVEDNLSVLKLTVKKLKNQNCTVLSAASGSEAIEILNSNQSIDIVFSDVNMPGKISGFDVAKWINVNRPGCKILLTSGVSDIRASVDSEFHTTVRLIAKPYRFAEMLSVLREMLHEGEAAQSITKTAT